MCGIVGIVGHPHLFDTLHDAGNKLQHRGTDGTGIILSDGTSFLVPSPHRVTGLVSSCFDAWPGTKPEDVHIGLLHVRYGTSGKRQSFENIQPFIIDSPRHGKFAIAHNGDSQDIEAIRDAFVGGGIGFASTSDTEVLGQLIAHAKNQTLPEAIVCALEKVKSAFALVIATPSSLIAVRDPYGYRPLSLGKFRDGGYIVASETASFEIVGAEYVRDIDPGEVLVIDKNGLHEGCNKPFQFTPQKHAQCVFELIYFSYPTSLVFGYRASVFRHTLGKRLAMEAAHILTDGNPVLIPVPESGLHYAQGVSHQSGIPLTFALSRSRYSHSGRTFIIAEEAERGKKLLAKFNINTEFVKGKDCVLVDDSVVRGNTMRALVQKFREHGARKVSVLVGSPPIMHPCRYGIDFKTSRELLAAEHHADVQAMCAFLGADALHYLALETLYEEVRDRDNFCFACFNGSYAL